MESTTDKIAGSAVEYSIALLRFVGGQKLEALAVLEALESDLVSLLSESGEMSESKRRLQAMLDQASSAITGAFADLSDSNERALEEVARLEGIRTGALLNELVGVDIFTAALSPRTLAAVVQEPVVLGHHAASWWTEQEAATKRRFVGQMQLGAMQGETNGQLIRRIRGTKANAFKDGIMNISRRDAAGLVRTSIMSISNAARIASLEEQDDIVKAIQWVATLDSRTTLICRALDKKRWTLPDYKPDGHDKRFPGPTAHFGCRSTQVPVTKSWSELAGRKLPSLDNRTLQQAIEERLAESGKDDAQIAAAVARSRASIDGQVSGSLDMQRWIKAKGADYAEQVLGPGRAGMFNAGKLTITELTDQDNRPLTLAELAAYVEKGSALPETLGKGYKAPKQATRTELAAQNKAAVAKIAELEARIAEAKKS